MNKNIVVADTIGLCDTEWDEKAIINLIKGRISNNFKYIDAVYVVFRADRLIKQYVDNINKMLDWLNYPRESSKEHDLSLRFLFVGTYADYLTSEKKEKLAQEAKEIFRIGELTYREIKSKKKHQALLEFESLVYTGFPPEETLNDVTKPRVEESWENISRMLRLPKDVRIKIEQNDKMCILQ